MKKLNRLLAALLSVAMVISMIPAAAFAEGEDPDDDTRSNEIPEDYDEYGNYYGDDPDKTATAILDLTTSSADMIGEDVMEALTSSGKSMVDIVFLIDSTGSMADEINGVRKNLNVFTQALENASLDYRIAVIEYKDITAWDEETSTQVLQLNGKTWLKSADDVADLLAEITVTGGGDWKETPVDALGCMLKELTFRTDASKFAFVLTDADYKDDNDYGYTGMLDVTNELESEGISVSVISDTDYQSTYYSLYNSTDGIFCDIYGDFAEKLAELAAYVKEAVGKVNIKLLTEKTAEQTNYNLYTTTATITSTDMENDVTGLTVKLELPSGLTVDGSATQRISSLGPGESETVTFDFKAPVKSTDKIYTIKVRATSDDFAVGAVCMAQDTINVPGYGETDYSFTFGKDNYSFINSSSAFGYGSNPYYISDEDLAAFLEDLNNTEIYDVAYFYAVDGTLENLRANNLEDWGGSCYGMSVTAALFKAGILDPEDWGGETTYSIPALDPDENSALESMINVYHISQMSDAAWSDTHLAAVGSSDFPEIVQTMWEMACNIGEEGSSQQLYVVFLSGDGGHAVLCYGGEECSSFVYNGETYNKRLLIADPNTRQGQYLYISNDFNSAYYPNNYGYAPTKFGYYTPDLLMLDAHNYEDNSVNHSIRIRTGDMSNFTISSGKKTAVVVDGEVVSGDLKVTEKIVVGGAEDSAPILIIQDEVSSLTITPDAGEKLDATVYYDDIALGVTGEASSATMTKAGKIEVKGAEGEVKITAVANDGNIDFATITGNAAGTVNVSVNTESSSINVKGDIEDTVVANTTREGTSTDVVLGDTHTVYVSADGSLTTDDSDAGGAIALAVGAGAVVAGTVIASEVASARAEAALPDSSQIHVTENGTEKTFKADVKGKTLTIKTEANTAVLTGSRSYIEQLNEQGYKQLTLAAKTSDKMLYVFPVTKKVTVDISTLLAETPQDGTFTVTLN